MSSVMYKRKQIVITKKDDNVICLYMIGNDIYDCVIERIDDAPAMGDVYVGRVDKVVDNIKAAFVDIGSSKSAFLQFEKSDKPKCEDEIVVQIKKPEKGEKGAVLTKKISLVGRYCVVNLKNESEYEVITRTNAKTADPERVEAERSKLVAKMESIIKHSDNRTVFSRVYKEPEFYIRFINSYHTDEVDRIITDDDEIYSELKSYDDTLQLEKYEDESYSIDALYAISSTLQKAVSNRVWLKSGATLVIDKTEAMTVIDVNTAKAIAGKRSSEGTFLKTNLEAADEIARQIRLRNVSGIIIIDFIDMKEKTSEEQLISHMKQLLADDPVRACYIDMTALGLMEITRTKRYKSIYDAQIL